MSSPTRRRHAGIALLALLVLIAPPVKHTLEASMTAQMLLQMPLLVGVGWLLAKAVPARARALLADWNHHGVTGLVLASVASAYWMLPRTLDASVTDPLLNGFKYLTVPLLIGMPISLGWAHMNFIVRGLFLVEFIATFFRLGWLYLIWPERLCNNYLLDDQQLLGQLMLLIGAALFLAIAGKLLWGRFDSLRESPAV